MAEAKTRFNLLDHPWIVFWLFSFFVILALALPGTVLFGILKLPQDSGPVGFVQQLIGHALLLLVFAPYLLGLPKGRKPLAQYLDDIGLTSVKPLARLILLGVTCYIIIMLCQVMGVIVYRLSEGKALDASFFRSAFDLMHDLPPRSMSLLVSFPSIFEEAAFRGVLLVYALTRYPAKKAILFSSAAFAVVHVLNVLSGRDPAWVAGQVVWAFVLGLFYGYLFVKTGSLLPNMIVHYLSNVFVGTLNHYVQTSASMEIQALYGVIFTFGIVPTVLMILWVRRVSSRRPFERQLA
jgi:membrane protease YdiL (CAAX protease family)